MSCNCNGICTQACAKGAVEPEEMVIKFLNNSGQLMAIKYCDANEAWGVYEVYELDESYDIFGEGDLYASMAFFKLLEQAEKCAEALKESV